MGGAGAILVAAVAVAVGGGCASSIATAPFPARADTVVPGDLRGPFEGRVLDASSGKPVDHATVLASWALEAGGALAGPDGQKTALLETDADGRYRVPSVEPPRDGRRLARFTLLVYKRGYVGYRSDRRFEDLSPRHDFAQTGNVAQLRELPADVSHLAHLAFLSPSGPIYDLAAWERPLAASELAERFAAEEPPAGRTRLDASPLLTPDELREVTGYEGDFTVEPLPDLPSSPTYDSVHFRAVDHSESWDAAMRVFKLPPEGAERQFDVMLHELPSATEGHEVGDRSLRAHEGQILALGALDRAHGVVVLFTCGESLCESEEKVREIMRRVLARARTTRQAPIAAPPATSAGGAEEGGAGEAAGATAKGAEGGAASPTTTAAPPTPTPPPAPPSSAPTGERREPERTPGDGDRPLRLRPPELHR